MTKREIAWCVVMGALLPAGSIGCVGNGDAGPQPTSGEIYAVAVQASTRSTLPMCGSNLAGTVAYVTSPPSLYACESDRGSFSWTAIACSSANYGSVAYANFTPPILLACLGKGWTPIPLPESEAGPPGPRGPAGPPGEAGAPALIKTTQLPPGDPNCPAGGVRIDTTSNGVVAPPVYVCNGGEEGDATVSDGPVGAADGGQAQNAVQLYVQEYAQAFCQGQYDCCEGYDAGFDDAAIAACESQVNAGTSMWETTLPTAYNAANLTIDGAQAATCLGALNPQSCGTLTPAEYNAITNACLGVFNGSVAVDASGCITSFECASGYCNLPGDGGVGTCKPLVGDGGSCLTQDMCTQAALPQTMFCSAVLSPVGSGTCQPLLPDGANCGGYDTICASGICAGNSFTTCGGNYPNPSVGDAGVCP